MMSNLEFYSAMASYTATHLTDSWQRWTAFLTTASRLYKYPFHEQLKKRADCSTLSQELLLLTDAQLQEWLYS